MFGYGFFLSGIYWITISLTFDESFKYLIPIALIIIPFLLALFYGFLLIALFPFIKRTISFVLIFSIFFSLMEYLRSTILTGFPWNLIGYTWSWSNESIQILSIIGTIIFTKLNKLMVEVVNEVINPQSGETQTTNICYFTISNNNIYLNLNDYKYNVFIDNIINTNLFIIYKIEYNIKYYVEFHISAHIAIGWTYLFMSNEEIGDYESVYDLRLDAYN